MITVKFLLHATFRSNPAFELIEQGKLNRQALDALAGLARDPECFGVFRRRDPEAGSGVKIAYKEVALLFYHLQEPGGLPQYFQSGYDDEVNLTMVKLVLEGIFEIQEDDRFFSGFAARHLLYEVRERDTVRRHPLLQMSAEAIRYAMQLNEADTVSLAAKLYAYNATPLFFTNTHALPDYRDVEAFLGVTERDPLGRELSKDWKKHLPNEHFRWISWSRRHKIDVTQSSRTTFKIYISPLLDELPAVFAKAVRVLTASAAFSFKVGMNREGLLRPDKFVAYFHTYAELTDATDRLTIALNGHQAQGVPFTAPLDESGLLSWGMDTGVASENETATSWRAVVTEKLAATISLPRSEKLSREESADFIQNKMMLEGVDASTWTAAS